MLPSYLQNILEHGNSTFSDWLNITCPHSPLNPNEIYQTVYRRSPQRRTHSGLVTRLGEYIVGGGGGLGPGVWRVEDGKQIATMAAWGVWCLTASQDGRWIAAGTAWGEVSVWDAKTFKNVFTHKEDQPDILGVDFLPDSARLVTASKNQTATVLDVAARNKVLTLRHNGWCNDCDK